MNQAVPKTYSISFWIFLAAQNNLNNQELLLSMAETISKFDYQIYLMPYGNLNFKLNDQKTSKKTSARLRQRQWNYVSLNIIQNKLIQFYVNSKLDFDILVEDKEFQFEPTVSKSIYIGGDPWHDSSDYKAYIDDLLVSASTQTS